METQTQGTVLIAVVWLLLGSPAPLQAQDVDTRLELERALHERAVEISKERDWSGSRFRRGSYSLDFRATGPDRFDATFTEDTAIGSRMRTQRKRLQLGRTDDGRFEIVEEETEDTYEQLVRDVPGDERFYRFYGFTLRREGLELDGNAGTLIVDHIEGHTNQLIWTAEDLRYEYRPPEDIGFHPAHVMGFLRNERRGDLVFTPEFVTVDCDHESCLGMLDVVFASLEEIPRDELTAPLAAHYRRLVQRQEKRRREDPFADFALPRRSDERRTTIQVRKEGEDRAVWLQLEQGAIDEVRFGATDYGVLFGYPALATRMARSGRAEVERRDAGNARDAELRSLSGTVEIAVRDTEELTADLRLLLRAKRAVKELRFGFNDLTRSRGRAAERNPSFTIDGLQDGDGNALTFVRLGAADGLVVLPRTFEAGEEIDLRIRYSSRGSIIKLSPSYSYMDRGGWLPFVRYTDPIEAFDLTVVTPERYTVLAVGHQVENRTADGLRQTRWTATAPVQFPTVIFGDYVSDTPRIAALRSDGTPIPVAIHVDRHGMMDWGIRGKQLRPLAEQAVNALNLFREIYATDYPYAKLDLVNQPGFFGGQAPGSIIYLSSGVFRGPVLTQIAPRGAGAIDEALVAHEVAHQWWGASVVNANPVHYWFVESLAEYSSALYLEMVAAGEGNGAAGRRAYQDKVNQWRELVMATDSLGSVVDAPTKWTNNGYRTALYAKGPYVFHMLRRTFGDELFFHFLKLLGRELAGGTAVTADIQRLAEIGLGGVNEDGEPFKIDLTWFFDQWLRGVGIPELRFEHRVSRTEDRHFLVEGRVRQRVLAGTKKRHLEGVFFKAAVDIVAVGKDGRDYPYRLWIEGPETPFRFKVPVKPRAVEFNRDGQVLAY